jgi:hypothetical protein
MTIIKNPFEVFLVTSKKQGNGIIESKVGLYSIKASSHICICQLNVSCGQDSMSGIVKYVPKVETKIFSHFTSSKLRACLSQRFLLLCCINLRKIGTDVFNFRLKPHLLC